MAELKNGEMGLRHAKWRITMCKHLALSNSSWVYLLQSVTDIRHYA